MRGSMVILGLVIVMASVYALDTNTVLLTAPADDSTITTDFNIVWDVNNANGDWNHFVVSLSFGTVVENDGDYNVAFITGTDFNTADLNMSHCQADVNDVYHCSYTQIIDGNFLRNGPFTIKIIGYKTDGNVFESNAVNVTLDHFNEFNAAVSSLSATGEMNITLSFECDVNTSSASVVLHTPSSGDVSISIPDVNDANAITVTVPTSELTKVVRGTILELNSGFSSSCAIPNDTNVLVTNLPDAYTYVPAKQWTAVTIPYVLDENYAYTFQALSEANTVARYSGGWDTNITDFYSEAYTFYGYYFYSESNMWIPLRWSSYYNKSSCKGGNYIALPTGWSFISVFCLDGGPSCADSNSSLVTLSFLEVNTTSMEVYKSPIYQFYGIPGSEGNTGTLVSGFGAIPTVTSASPYWVWINPNWVQNGFTVYYYGACVSVPNLP